MSTRKTLKTVVAGHVCLDIIPQFLQTVSRLDALVVPGKLVELGPAVVGTGGAVANTGLALHRLRLPVTLMGKVGEDAFGHAVLDVFRRHDPALVRTMIVDPDVSTSYTVVINLPGIDRSFLHCPGANDTFAAEDVKPDLLRGMDLFHFGYPPLMRRMYAEAGELRRMIAAAKAAGLTTSLDMALPDPASPAGRAGWTAILADCLPEVDVFMPSLDEIVYMLDPREGERIRMRAAEGVALGGMTPAGVREVAERLIGMGVAAVMIKLGNQGAYLRVTSDPARLARCGRAASTLRDWAGADFHAPCFVARVAGTTGSGDCTIAGLLASLARGLGAAEAVRMAVAVGSASVEKPDATSGVPDWDTLLARVAGGWARERPKVVFAHTA
jgi:sugar/nucleoside kinase (ribokinase family)